MSPCRQGAQISCHQKMMRWKTSLTESFWLLTNTASHPWEAERRPGFWLESKTGKGEFGGSWNRQPLRTVAGQQPSVALG